MSNTTQIKRLYQSGNEFVPITLQEAVVVNTSNISSLSSLGITTLDKVLRTTMQLVDANTQNISTVNDRLGQAVIEINDALSKKQDKLTAGQGITIEQQGDNLVISTSISFEIYKIVEVLPEASSQLANTIYLVPSTGIKNEFEKDTLEEYLCVQKTVDGQQVWAWERLGRIQADTDISEYVTRIEDLEREVQSLKELTVGTITAQDVTTSQGNKVIVTYTIPEDLYDSVVSVEDGDKITT